MPAGRRRRFGYEVGLLQQAVGSAYGPVWGAWSNVTAIRPPSLYAAERLISGTTDFRNRFAAASPGLAPRLQGASLPSAHTGGMMYASDGVVFSLFRSLASRPTPTSFRWQAVPEVSEWKYRNGLRQARYSLWAVAVCGCLLPSFGTWQAVAALLLTPPTYAFQLSPAAAS